MPASSEPSDWRGAIRERLLRRSSDLDWADLWPEVVSIRTDLLARLSQISVEQAAWKPSEDGWSIEETAQHLLASSVGVLAIIEALTAGRDPLEGTPYDGPADVTAHEVVPPFEGSFDALRDAFREHSIEFAALPGRLPPSPDLERTFPHMYFGPLPARAWFAFQRVHDRAHLQQIEEIVAAEGYPAG